MFPPLKLKGAFDPYIEASIYRATVSFSKNESSRAISPRARTSASAPSDIPREKRLSGTASLSFSTEVNTFLPTSSPFSCQLSNQEPLFGNHLPVLPWSGSLSSPSIISSISRLLCFKELRDAVAPFLGIDFQTAFKSLQSCSAV